MPLLLTCGTELADPRQGAQVIALNSRLRSRWLGPPGPDLLNTISGPKARCSWRFQDPRLVVRLHGPKLVDLSSWTGGWVFKMTLEVPDPRSMEELMGPSRSWTLVVDMLGAVGCWVTPEVQDPKSGLPSWIRARGLELVGQRPCVPACSRPPRSEVGGRASWTQTREHEASNPG